MNYFTVKEGVVENKGTSPFEIDGETVHKTKKKIELGYRYEDGVISPPDTTARDEKKSAWRWAEQKLYENQLSGQAKWIRAIKHPNLRKHMTDEDWNNLITAWKDSI